MFEVEDLSEKALFPRFGMEEVERFGLLFRDAEKNAQNRYTVSSTLQHSETWNYFQTNRDYFVVTKK